MCVSLASDSSETIDVTISNLGMVTASDMLMHHVLSILICKVIVGRQRQNRSVELCRELSKQQTYTFATMIGHFSRDLEFANVYMA